MLTNPQPYQLGYTYYPPRHAHDPGHPRLDILLRSSPTGLHFDPEHVNFPILSGSGEVETLTLNHPGSGVKEYRLYPGRILMYDYQEKIARAFTFGGKLEINPTDQLTLCTVQSNAPILNLTVERSVAGVLAEEVEALLAEHRAAWAHQIDAFQQRLGAMDPLLLYHTCLNSLRQRFKHFPAGVEGVMQKFHHFLIVESQAMQEEHHLPSQSDTLEELFNR